MVKPDPIFVCGLRPKVGAYFFRSRLSDHSLALSVQFIPPLWRRHIFAHILRRRCESQSAARIYWIAGQRQKRRWHTHTHTPAASEKVIPQRAAAIKLWVAFMKGVIRLAPSSRARTDWRRLLATPFRVWKEEAFEASSSSCSMEPWDPARTQCEVYIYIYMRRRRRRRRYYCCCVLSHTAL